MKKFGFTLAELIITLSIIAIAAALIAPSLNKLVPDKNKVSVIKYNTKIQNTIEDMFNDQNLYHPTTDSVNTLSCEGIACIDDFEDLFRERLIDNVTDGSEWVFTQDPVTGEYTLSINIDKRKPTKIFSVNDTTNINTFVFLIDRFGNVTAGDPLTQAYLRNPLNMNDRKADYDTAKTLATND